MASAKALRLNKLRNIEERVVARANECRSNMGASEGDKSGEGLREEWGIYPEGRGSHRWTQCSPNLPVAAACPGGLFSATRREVQL